MRSKQINVCQNCRQHKIGCDGKQPGCTQCKLTGRSCVGYTQELLIVQHKPSSRQKKCTFQKKTEQVQPSSSLLFHDSTSLWPTYEESVAIIVERYIPSDEIPFLSPVSPSRSRICGGWVQALPYVEQTGVGFEQVLLPAVRSLVMSMMITSEESRRQYLYTYGGALRGIRARISKENDSTNSALSLASMCLTLSEVMMPTSSEGSTAHIQGVAGMMQSRGPSAFCDGITHLLFVGFRPLIVLEALMKRRRTFLAADEWRAIPFSTQSPSPMQVLLGQASTIPLLLEEADKADMDVQVIRKSFASALDTLKAWEDDFLSRDDTVYWPVPSAHLKSSVDPQLLPDTCFEFLDVSHANSLSHCWAFQIVCLLQLDAFEEQMCEVQSKETQELDHNRKAGISGLCTQICQGLPYLLQPEMSLYGPLSATFPLRMVSESLKSMPERGLDQSKWCNAIQDRLISKGIMPM
ncbi:hypothetical protein HBI24_000610 [Parastagonospora nodorum]|nr:hypothetical protein HBH51_053270 [Parastagonospora nodorum]KAH3980419.1 hypothetical protein HBH52_089410 [Parastagonospora nodorum]KAH4180158.1 hypothetical protein HBH43_000360 [Parastagonospora nodorum]KAH4294452.1 hypothetical protein HBI02_181130 [Parastagonospora nodorum]KAH4307037.1 hypothetical protein HBI01_048470 [Parastagonospora nodorum]